jgi:hypothetical protein
LKEAGGNVHRKGATPAHPGQPLLIPGSMGDDSYLLDGRGHERWASSASHGNGYNRIMKHLLPHIQIGRDGEDRVFRVVGDCELSDFISADLGDDCDFPYEYD